MDQVSSQKNNTGVAKPRVRTNKRERNMSEKDSLETHVILCELRYKQLDERMDRVEQRMDDITTDLKAVKSEMNAGFDEIKALLTAGEAEKFKTLVVTAGSVVVGLLGLLGYIVVHLK